MSTRLGEDDKRAVDLFLDRTAPSGHAAMYAVPGQDGFERRVKSVASLLRLLDAMPADDPPADLADRTVRRIEQGGFKAPAPHISTISVMQPKTQA